MKQIGKNVLAIALVTAMTLQLVTGLTPMEKEVKASETEPNFLDVSYDFMNMDNDGLAATGLKSREYSGSRSGDPYVRWAKSEETTVETQWTITDRGLEPQITNSSNQFFKLFVAEEQEAYELKFEAKGNQYGIDIGSTEYVGYTGDQDTAMFGFSVHDGGSNIRMNGTVESTITAISGCTVEDTEAGRVIPNDDTKLTGDTTRKWTVIVQGKNVVVSEETTGIKFSCTMHGGHEKGLITLKGIGTTSTQATSTNSVQYHNVSVNYVDTYYDFMNMDNDGLAATGMQSREYSGSRSGTPSLRRALGEATSVETQWEITSKGLEPKITKTSNQFFKLFVAEEQEAYELKFEAKGNQYGIDIGSTEYVGYTGDQDTAMFGFSVHDGGTQIRMNGTVESTITAISGCTVEDTEAGRVKPIDGKQLTGGTTRKWTVSVQGKNVVVSEETTGIKFSCTMHEGHEKGLITLKGIGTTSTQATSTNSVQYHNVSVNYPVAEAEEPDPEGTYTFTKKMYQNNLHASGITADIYASSMNGHDTRLNETADGTTADDLWSVSTSNGLTPKDTTTRQYLKAHLSDESDAFELKFEAYGSYYGFSIGTTAYMGNNNPIPQDKYTAEMYIMGNQILMSGVDEDTLNIISNGEYNAHDGGIVQATTTIPSDLAKWTVTVLGVDITVSEEYSGVKFVIRMNEGHEQGKISLRTSAPAGTTVGFYSASVSHKEADPKLIAFDNLDLSELEGWTSRIYNTETGEITSAEDIADQWFTGMDYTTNVENWNSTFDPRNNPGLKPRVLTNEKTPYILTSANDYENFESYFTYYQHSIRYGMIIGDKASYPTTVSDSAVYVYIHGSQSSGYELRVSGAVDIESGILTGTDEGEILTSSDAVRLPLNQYGFSPEVASATKTTTVHVKVQDGVLTASVDDIEATIQVNLASTYVHGGISLVSTGSAHGGFKYLRVEELEETEMPEAGVTSYTMSSKDEYAVVTINKEVAYSTFKVDVNYDDTKYEYVKAIYGDANYRMNGSGKKILPSADGKVSVEAYSNTADTYVSLYFKTKDRTIATDFNGFSVDAEKMFAVGGKEIAKVSSSIALEQDHKQDNKLDIVDLVRAKKDVSDEAATETREVLVGKNTVSPLFGKTALFLGDSIMNSVTDGMGWYGRLTAYGMDCDEVAQDGWALTSDAGRSRIISQFQYADENKEYDFVMLEGGVNDILIKGDDAVWGDENIDAEATTYDTTTIAGAMQELIKKTQGTYGNAKIVYVINSEFGSSVENRQKLVELVKKVSAEFGIDYVNLSDTDAYPELEVINDENHAQFRDYMVDNIHPNAASYALTTPIVAKRMVEVLLNSEARTCVYVDALNGINTGNGTKDAPYQSMGYAVNKVADGGEIIIKGEYSYGETGSLGVKGKTITVSGDTLNLSATKDFNINGPVVLGSEENGLSVKVNTDGNVYANGNYFEVKENVVFDNTLKGLYGGTSAASVDSTHMVIKAGSYGVVYGGGPNGAVNGDTYLFVGGTVNEGSDSYQHDNMEKCMIVGGSFNATVKGDTCIIFDGDKAEVGCIYGAGYGVYSSVQGTTNVTISNGKVYSVYGGSSTGSSNSTNVLVEGGTVAQIFGGSAAANLTGSTFVEVKGGTVTRRIYGGCYNEWKLTWQSDYHVIGNTTVVLHDGVTYGTEEDDNAICATSRRQTNTSTDDEVATLKIETETLYNQLNGRLKVMETGAQGYDDGKLVCPFE